MGLGRRSGDSPQSIADSFIDRTDMVSLVAPVLGRAQYLAGKYTKARVAICNVLASSPQLNPLISVAPK